MTDGAPSRAEEGGIADRLLARRPVLFVSLFALFWPFFVSVLFVYFYAYRATVPFVGGDGFLGFWVMVQAFATLMPPVMMFFRLPLQRGRRRYVLIGVMGVSYCAVMAPLSMAAQFALSCLLIAPCGVP